MKSQVTAQIAEVVEEFGFYDIYVRLELLENMEEFQLGIVMLSCVFNVVLILMCSISILLIYSLLMVSVQQKTFDTGVLRMVGVSKLDCVLFNSMQTLAFVISALIFSYAAGMLINYLLLSQLYSPEMGLTFNPTPDWFATVQALTMGLLIPMLSSILPI